MVAPQVAEVTRVNIVAHTDTRARVRSRSRETARSVWVAMSTCGYRRVLMPDLRILCRFSLNVDFSGSDAGRWGEKFQKSGAKRGKVVDSGGLWGP